jgi:hypothetical protein
LSCGSILSRTSVPEFGRTACEWLEEGAITSIA